MSRQLTRGQFTKDGQLFERLLVNSEPAAIVAPVRDQAAELFISFYGHQWEWWVLVSGVKGGPWLLRNANRDTDAPLLLDSTDQPAVTQASWDGPAKAPPRIRTRVGRKPMETSGAQKEPPSAGVSLGGSATPSATSDH